MNNKKTRKHSAIPASERERETYLERDLDGYVHTPAGFLSKGAYIALHRDHPDLLPAWGELPLMQAIEHELAPPPIDLFPWR